MPINKSQFLQADLTNLILQNFPNTPFLCLVRKGYLKDRKNISRRRQQTPLEDPVWDCCKYQQLINTHWYSWISRDAFSRPSGNGENIYDRQFFVFILIFSLLRMLSWDLSVTYLCTLRKEEIVCGLLMLSFKKAGKKNQSSF